MAKKTKKWEKLDNVSENIKAEPWSMYWNEMKSGSAEFEKFLHDPLPVLRQAVDDVDETFTVQTTVLNHQNGLLSNAVCQVGIVDPKRKIVYLTLYKH